MAHVHHHIARSPVIAEWHEHNLAQLANDLVKTVVNVVYVTAGTDDSTSAIQQDASSTAIVSDAAVTSVTKTVYNAPSRQVRPEPSTSSDAVSTTDSSLSATSSASQTTLASSISSGSLFVASSATVAATSLDVAAPASTAASIVNASSQSNGMTSGAKAGLAIGILIVVALMAALIVFFARRNKRAAAEEHRRLDDEKSEMREKRSSIASRVSVHQSRNNAPRLSLRPLTQIFMPSSEKQDAAGSVGSTDAVSQEAANPFGDHASDKIMAVAPAIAVAAGDASERTMSNVSDRSGSADGQAFPVGVAGSRRNSPPGPGPNNVHRIQLDFKPSMEDELELRAGSLVRMLHEYDDGWALCIRLDRSQQGVVPRTCISKLPVKPRSGPPPPSVRQGPAQIRIRGPGDAASLQSLPRGLSSNSRTRSQSNAPLQSQQQHSSQSTEFNHQQVQVRSTSDAATAVQESVAPVDIADEGSRQAASATLPARKPVPGQAM